VCRRVTRAFGNTRDAPILFLNVNTRRAGSPRGTARTIGRNCFSARPAANRARSAPPSF